MASVKDDSNDEAISLAEQELVARRWSILWRSIILSAMGKTLFPYCQFIRVLDMRDFNHLLDDDRFKGRIRDQFFSGDLKRFHLEVVPKLPPRVKPNDWRRRPRLDNPAITHAVGELLTEKTPIVDTITGPIAPSSLRRWIPRLPRLQSLELYDGTGLDAEIAELLRAYCPKFNACSIFQSDISKDEGLSAFFSGLKEQSLKSFITFSMNGFGLQCCLAISRHSSALTELRLNMLPAVIPHLGLLKGLTALETLALSDDRKTVDLEAEQNDVFLELIEWLKSCKNLRTLRLGLYNCGAAVATPVLVQDDIRLRHLEVLDYATRDHRSFHLSLSNQRQLEHLILDSDVIESFDEIQALLASLCQLRQLRVLRLIGVSSLFGEDDIKVLSDNLQMLEEFYTAGLFLDDTALESVSQLRNLKVMTFLGTTRFTFQGLFEFAKLLREPGHQNFLLAVDNADPDASLSEEEQAYMRAAFAEQCGGKLEYTLVRGEDLILCICVMEWRIGAQVLTADRSQCFRI